MKYQANADILALLRAASLLITYCDVYNIAIRHGSVDYLAVLNKAVETVEQHVDLQPWIEGAKQD